VLGGSGAVFEAPALVAGLDDIAMMSKPVEQRGGHLGIVEDARPFADRRSGDAAKMPHGIKAWAWTAFQRLIWNRKRLSLAAGATSEKRQGHRHPSILRSEAFFGSFEALGAGSTLHARALSGQVGSYPAALK